MATKDTLTLDRRHQSIIYDVARQRKQDPQVILDTLVDALQDQAITENARKQIIKGQGIPQSEMNTKYFPELREIVRNLGEKKQQKA